jgi:hypothetical protein
MKSKINLFYLLIVIFSFTSCGKDQEILKPEENAGEKAIEVLNHMTIIEQNENLNIVGHKDFVSEELLQAYASNPGFIQKVKSAANQDPDTLFSYDEIPLVRETESKTLIFSDGRSETYIEDLTPFDVNPVNFLSETPDSDSARISRTIIKNGVLSVYNKAGQLITSEEYPENDYTEFLDTIKVYLAMALLNTQQSVNRASKVQALKKNLPDGSVIQELSNGNLIYEVKLDNQSSGNQGLAKIQGTLTGRTELDPDLNRTLSFELFQGSNLIHRKVFSYGTNEKLNSFFNNKMVAQNPELIESQTLIINSRGLPVIRHIREFYSQNQTLYFFKN